MAMSRMSMREVVGLTLALTAALPLAAVPPGPALGHALTPAEIDALRTTVYPDGSGLPTGSGSVREGEAVYRAHCLVCHGPEGQGATADELAGGRMPLDSETPDKVIGTYWPYATTLFDFIDRAMPLNAPKSLSVDEVYAVTAYLLHLNGLVDADATLGPDSLAAIRMPNRDGFIWIDAPK